MEKSKRQLLAIEYASLDQEKDAITKRETEINKRMKDISLDLVQEMEAEGIDRFHDSELGKTFFLNHDMYVNIKDDNKFYAWVRETGQDSVIKETIHASTRTDCRF